METYKGFSEPPKQENQQRKLGDYAELLARWIVDLVSLPVSFIAHLVAQFITPGASGTKIVGAIGFFIGTLLSTDSIWQVMFQGVPIFPWFEDYLDWLDWLATIAI
ncbi:hypothetical protein [Tolypothrix sp. PCC 7910]|uniref:hypothetical protein n=1 Tax=Tolypothrix sp. PCC 7910 TaxID=2099387 RepID=UPI001FCBB2C5|nr:hypothetical protein [Tolypothrix sp. PCC 7910]